MKKLSPARPAAFTLVELLTVMLIILILAGLVLASVGYAQKKAARSRAEGEIAALTSAIENYKTDNGTYPRGNSTKTFITPVLDSQDAETDTLNPNFSNPPAASGDATSTAYKKSSLALYVMLSGDSAKNGVTDTGRTNYLSKGFRDDLFGRDTPSDPIKTGNLVTYLSDPFGNSYGYSSANSHYFVSKPTADPSKAPGYNPTFDLWSTGGDATAAVSATTQAKWIKNW